LTDHDTPCRAQALDVTDAINKDKPYGWSQPIGATGWTKQLIGK
jgi:hypothetical protein